MLKKSIIFHKNSITKVQIISFLLFCYLLLTHSLLAQTQLEIEEKINELVYEELEINFERSPCFIVGIIARDSTFIFPFGSTKKDTSILPSPDNLFEIGNLTNIFTASLVNILAKKNILDKDVSINNYLPDSIHNHTAKTITIQQLLTHTSGLPRVPLGIGMTQKEDNQPYMSYTKKMLAEYYKTYNFATAEVGKYNYSHLGYALIELIIEENTGVRFEEILRNNLLEGKFPDTKINLSSKEKKLLVEGFDKSYQSTKPWQYSSFSSAVGLKSNLKDLLTLLRENIDKNDFEGMHKALIPSGMEKNIFAGEAWHIIQPKKYHPIVLHTGATSGYRGYMAFVKETRTGVVVLSNSEYALRGLGYFILQELNKGFRKK
jgi:CubicO group peptidase (beta-lactamase class C family)